MGRNHSKEKFSQWDLDRFSNVTGIPRATVEKLYQDFITSTGKDNQMDKKEFRRLYKEMYLLNMNETVPMTGPTALSEHDLDKLSDRVFKAFDTEGSGKLTFEEFVNAVVLLSRNKPNAAINARDRLNYILDQNNPTPGFVSREQGEQVFNYLNRFSTDATTPVKTSTWEQHWSKIDDGTGRVPQAKFVEYVTTSDDYRNHFDVPVM